jgi:hypothetical protein
VAAGVGALWQGMRQVATGRRATDCPAGALRAMCGLRGMMVTVSVAALGGGLLCASTELLVFAVICLGEELYETGFVLLAWGAGQRGVWA